MNRSVSCIAVVAVGCVLCCPACSLRAEDLPPLTREQTVAFIRDMANYVDRYHLQNDDSPQRGTVHEMVVTTRLKGELLPAVNPGQWGQWIQPVGGDTMHAAMAYSVAMLHAARATGDERYTRFVTDYSMPWIHKIITESDTLFPDQAGTKRTGVVLKIDRPLKGYVPFWWDEGQVICPFPDQIEQYWKIVGTVNRRQTELGDEFRFNGYVKAVSQHLAQYIAVMLMEAWWHTHDPRAAESAKVLLDFWETASPWRIPSLIGAAGAANGDEAVLRRVPNLQHGEQHFVAWNALYGFAEKKPEAVILMPGFQDETSFSYYTELMKHGSQITPEAARALISLAWTDPLLIEYWSDTPEPVRPGLGRYERAAGFVEWQQGAPRTYRSERRIPFGVRSGTQTLALSMLALQALRSQPEVWDQTKAERHPSDWLVPSHPTDEGKWSEPWQTTGGNRLELKSRRRSLDLRGTSAAGTMTIRVSGRPDEGSPWADLTLNRDGSIAAVNHEGKAVQARGTVEPQGDGFSFTLNVPYTANKGQNAWANGIDHGRYRIAVGGESRVAYFLTPTAELTAALQRHCERALAGLHAVFHEYGYLPYVIDDGSKHLTWGNAGPGEKMSHLYGYAYVVSAAAQHLIYADDKAYWPVDRTVSPKP